MKDEGQSLAFIVRDNCGEKGRGGEEREGGGGEGRKGVGDFLFIIMRLWCRTWQSVW